MSFDLLLQDDATTEESIATEIETECDVTTSDVSVRKSQSPQTPAPEAAGAPAEESLPRLLSQVELNGDVTPEHLKVITQERASADDSKAEAFISTMTSSMTQSDASEWLKKVQQEPSRAQQDCDVTVDPFKRVDLIQRDHHTKYTDDVTLFGVHSNM